VYGSRFVRTLARLLRGKAGMTSRLGGGVMSQEYPNVCKVHKRKIASLSLAIYDNAL
jgi:hypothetical protein